MLINFKENFNGGTRSNRFRITGNFPFGGQFTDYHVRATTIPTVSTKNLSYDYFGRKYYYPGEKEYGTWSFQSWDDIDDNNMWGKLQRWQDRINNHDTNKTTDLKTQNVYKAYDWFVDHLDLNDRREPLKRFILHGCWPAAIQPVTLNMGSPNVLNSFNVIIVFDYLEILGVTRR